MSTMFAKIMMPRRIVSKTCLPLLLFDRTNIQCGLIIVAKWTRLSNEMDYLMCHTATTSKPICAWFCR